MSKTERVAELVNEIVADPTPGLDPNYEGYFRCFNQQLYYEAHDVLEQLWLRQKDSDTEFYKGLIQLAGAYVHLQKQYSRPLHPKDGRRMYPAVRLFGLALRQIASYQPYHLHLDLLRLKEECLRVVQQIEESGFTRNPWSPDSAPVLNLDFPGRLHLPPAEAKD